MQMEAMDQVPQARPRAFEPSGEECTVPDGRSSDMSGFFHSVVSGDTPRSGLAALLAGILLTAATAICYRLNVGFASTAFVYFVIVILHSLVGGFFASALISLMASACLDYFFLPPVFSFRVNAPVDALGLATFVLTSFTVNSLSYRLKNEARTVARQRDNVSRLYEVAQQLLMLEPSQISNDQALKVFVDTFRLEGICVYGGASEKFFTAGKCDARMERDTRETYLSGQDKDDELTGLCYRCLRSTQGVTGAIGFQGLRDAALIASPLTALAALTMERASASRSANHAAALAATEAFRATVLDALAHEFKTPLSTILTAAGGMREFGPLAQTQLEFAEIVETEAARLGTLTTRLLRTARLESDQLVSKPQMIDLEELVLSVAKRYSKLSPDRRFTTVTYGEVSQVRADPELLRLALSQLLDNATKYSTQQTAIDIELERRAELVSISVWNSGRAIPDGERELIFERFYRGAELESAVAGSGLGLHVARRIAMAHHGDIVYEAVPGTKPAVVFRIQIPAGEGGP